MTIFRVISYKTLAKNFKVDQHEFVQSVARTRIVIELLCYRERRPRLFDFAASLLTTISFITVTTPASPRMRVSAACESFSDGTSPVSVMMPLLLVASIW